VEAGRQAIYVARTVPNTSYAALSRESPDVRFEVLTLFRVKKFLNAL